ncbi:precorrin-6A/cobalt-precorrin-6A reductase [Pseudonocardia ammonioxydans]|uniref:Precorrin-6A/cobalt-precorrin-6A reductase n=1 Tax=Pseudonocardia ammonioxydans TaxID=260086 RepID=A0A1I4VJV0_PSUAM|nr:cobalt-precorrin-6A reductase [Pseudonocardia ammonioxydans]SFN01538.1 precorrin-6A/cobalt-precorrin-6A reductase [Pseudonocardia ammonioxydans]
MTDPRTPTAPTVLVLGGTTEGRAAAAALSGLPGVRVVSSLAGAVRSPRLPDGEVRVGGFGGAEGLAGYLRAEGVGAVLDATHPFASGMTANAARACATTGVRLVVLRRPGWTPGPGDRWHRVASVPGAAAALPALLPGPDGRVLLTTGRGGLAGFADVDARFFVRLVDPPPPPLPARHTLLLDRGPFDLAAERALFDRVAPHVLVTKDSGGEATAPKLAVARERGLPVVVVDRPPLPPGVSAVATVEEAVSALGPALRQRTLG